MLVFIPAGLAEIEEKSKWFDKPAARRIKNKGIGFGFEMKGSVRGLRHNDIPHPYGIHLPNNLATEWRNPSRRMELQKEIEAAASLKPLYAVLHGMMVSPRRMGYADPPTKEELSFVSDVGADEYLKACDELIEFIKYLQELNLPVALETLPITDFMKENGVFQPRTYLGVSVGLLHRDMKEIQRRTGCRLLVDIEHLNFTVNFAKRKHYYGSIPNSLPQNLSPEEKKIKKMFGIFIRRGWSPVIQTAGFQKELEKIGAGIYHLSGSYNGRDFLEVYDGKVVSHNPIYPYDRCFREHLRIALKQNPEILVLETVRGGNLDNPCWSYLPHDSQERSFENLCQILNESR